MEPYSILFVCTANSVRSLFAEYLLRSKSGANFEVLSAGSHPIGYPHSLTVEVLWEDFHIDASEAPGRSLEPLLEKHWDFIITVCDQAKGTCPVVLEQSCLAHWPSPDPPSLAQEPTEHKTAFRKVALQIEKRIDAFLKLPLEAMNPKERLTAVQMIGTQFVDLNEL